MSVGAPATAHFFIVNRFSGGCTSSLFSTHPSVDERVRRVEAVVGRGHGRAA